MATPHKKHWVHTLLRSCALAVLVIMIAAAAYSWWQIATDTQRALRFTPEENRKAVLRMHRADLADDSLAVAESAARKLSHMGSDGVQVLIEALKDPNPRVRRLASEAFDLFSLSRLSRYGEVSDTLKETIEAENESLTSAIPALTEMLDHENDAVRVAAAWAIFELTHDWSKVSHVFRSAVASPNSEARNMALYRLKDIGPTAESAAPVVREVLDHPDPYTRVISAYALYKITGRADESVPVLIEALKTRPKQIRLNAIAALMYMGPQAEDAAPALIEALHSGKPDRRETIYICEALGSIGVAAAPALPMLQMLASGHDEGISSFARRAISQIQIREVTEGQGGPSAPAHARTY